METLFFLHKGVQFGYMFSVQVIAVSSGRIVQLC